jgi:dihydrofolate synthase/folylpolyglutamate synthase
MTVFRRRCQELSAPLYDSTALPVEILEETLRGCRFRTEVFDKPWEVEISMKGRHQINNALEALMAVELLRREGKLSLRDEDVLTGLARARQIGRFEIMAEKPYIIIDGAHNPDGARALAETVCKHFAGKRILMVIGILADKEVERVLDRFLEITREFIVTEPDNPRKLSAQALAPLLEERGASCLQAEKPEDAVALAKSKQGEYDLLLFAGSLYLIGEIRRYLHG